MRENWRRHCVNVRKVLKMNIFKTKLQTSFAIHIMIKSMTHTSPPRNHPGGNTNTLIRFGGGYETGDHEGDPEVS